MDMYKLSLAFDLLISYMVMEPANGGMPASYHFYRTELISDVHASKSWRVATLHINWFTEDSFSLDGRLVL